MTTNSDQPRLSPLVAAGLGLLALGIFLGAFGAHALAPHISEKALQTYKTGQLYHLVGALAVMALGILDTLLKSARLRGPGWMVAGGTVIFAVSLYLLATTGVRWLGAVAPVGGVLMIGGAGLASFWAAKMQKGPLEPSS